MTNTKVIEEKPINMIQLKDHLGAIKKRDQELNFRAAKTEEYLNVFIEAEQKDAKDLFKEIESFSIPRLKPEHIHKLIDIMPVTPDEVKSTLQGYSLTVKPEDLKRISDAVIKVMPEKKAKEPQAE